MTGLVIGKFDPPHLGHDFLISTAASQVDRLFIIVCGKRGQAISPIQRLTWMQQFYPQASVYLLDQDSFDDSNSQVWADAITKLLGEKPDILFTSERYGDEYAPLLGAKHVLVDLDRKAVPCSAGQIRKDPEKYAAFVKPEVLAYLQKQGDAHSEE